MIKLGEDKVREVIKFLKNRNIGENIKINYKNIKQMKNK